MISKIKNKIVNSNVYTLELACKIRSRKSERLTKKILKKLDGIDPILNYQLFQKTIEPMLQTKQYLSFASFGAESLHYGHLDALYGYAGRKGKANHLLFPAMEHAVAYGGIRTRSKEEIRRNLSFIYQSEYRKDEIHAINSLKPIFCIGPYIQYAHNVYSEQEMTNLKKKYGKVLTVFAAHHREDQTLEYNDKELIEYVMSYAKKEHYDTVLVSVYFCDTDKTLYKEFEKKGAILISAGFREDKQFIHRLRTIFALSDMVIANNVGTPLGFCKFLGIPYLMVKKNNEIMSNEELIELPITNEYHMKSFDKIKYLSAIVNKSELQQKIYDELYVYYSGTENLLRTPKDINAIISVMEKILYYSKGFFNKYNWAVEKVLKQCEQNKSSREYKVLKEAIGIQKK